MSKHTSTSIKTGYHPLSRRGFLRTSAAGAAWLGVPGLLRAAAPGAKLNHACIGVGGMMGFNDLQNFKGHPKAEVVALCDVDANSLKRASELVPGARVYADWREMLEKEGDKIDSVNATVPDHMHFPIAHTAIRRRKHVYCQKPMCHDVAEVRELTRAAEKAGVMTQLGTQAASGTGDRTAVSLLKAGTIGKAQHAYLCSNRPGAVEAYRLKGPRPSQGVKPPEHLNWDLWIGTAPMRPFVPDIYHPSKWRAWLDFGTGWSGDIGCHIFDAVWKGLGLKAPKSVIAEVQESWRTSPERRADTWPQGDHITWVFPGNERTAASELVLEWFDGEYYPPDDIRRRFTDDFSKYPPESAMVVGTEGAMLIGYSNRPVLLPEAKFKDFKWPDLPSRNHYHHFVDACLGGEKTESHFTQTGPMTEAILLGTVAIRVPQEKLVWNAGAMKFPGHPEAEKLLRRTYRDGWKLGGV